MTADMGRFKNALAQELSPVPLVSEAVESYAIDGFVPYAIAKPSSVEEVSQALAGAHRLGAAVVPWGGGTRMALGNVPAWYELALDLTGLRGDVVHRHEELTATVPAGWTLEALQAMLSDRGQHLPVDVPMPNRATLGGILATGMGGALSAAHGLPRDLVVGMKAVLADGTAIHSGGTVVKNVTGYALERLYVGSLGTLGVIVEATVKLAPLPTEERTLVMWFPRGQYACQAAAALARSGIAPRSAEVLNWPAWETVLEAHPVAAGDKAPEDWGYRLVVRLGGRPRTVERQEREALAVCAQARGEANAALGKEEGRGLWRALGDLGWQERYRLAVRGAIRASALPQAVDLLEEMGQGEEITPAIALHATLGVVRAFWTGVPSRGARSVREIGGVLEDIRREMKSLGGSMVVERAPIEIKRVVDVWETGPEALHLARGLKSQYDPTNVLNPGRFMQGI